MGRVSVSSRNSKEMNAMKRMITAALALTLLSGTSALAQQPDSGGHRGDQDRGQRGGEGFRNGDRDRDHGDRGHNGGHDWNGNGRTPDNYRPRFGAPGFRPGAERPRYNPDFFPRSFRPEHRYEWRGERW